MLASAHGDRLALRLGFPALCGSELDELDDDAVDAVDGVGDCAPALPAFSSWMRTACASNVRRTASVMSESVKPR